MASHSVGTLYTLFFFFFLGSFSSCVVCQKQEKRENSLLRYLRRQCIHTNKQNKLVVIHTFWSSWVCVSSDGFSLFLSRTPPVLSSTFLLPFIPSPSPPPGFFPVSVDLWGLGFLKLMGSGTTKVSCFGLACWVD